MPYLFQQPALLRLAPKGGQWLLASSFVLLAACSGQPEVSNSSVQAVSSAESSLVASSQPAASISSVPASSAMAVSSVAVSSSAPILGPCGLAANGAPYCAMGDATDADAMGITDGWGWESGTSCVVPNGAQDPAPGTCGEVPASSSDVASSVGAASSVAADGCGIAMGDVPYCLSGDVTDANEAGELDGWGWENNASCIVPDGLADPNPGACVLDIPDTGGGNSAGRIMYNGQAVYLSGFNIAWFSFAGDFGSGINEQQLRQALLDVSGTGGNSLRWWMHTDGSSTPGWGTVNGQRMVTNPGGTAIADLRRALDIAAEYNVYIIPALWSFDMLRDNAFRQPPTQDNYRLLSNDAVLQSYIDNALIPMVTELNKHPQLIAWELFNEPENMTESWFYQADDYYGGPVPTREQLQRTQAKMAAAIHRTAIANGEVALVTTGSKSMGKYNSDVAGGYNWYRDDRMIAAADGDAMAVLDFYEPHYYNNEGRNGAWSPFHHDANYWGVNKPIVIGEFYVDKPLDVLGKRVEGVDMCNTLEANGYAGGWPWQWNEYASELKACIERVDAN